MATTPSTPRRIHTTDVVSPSGAKIEKSDGSGDGSADLSFLQEQGVFEGQVAAGEEALAKVAANDLIRIADCGQISAGVPFEQEVEICRKLRE